MNEERPSELLGLFDCGGRNWEAGYASDVVHSAAGEVGG